MGDPNIRNALNGVRFIAAGDSNHYVPFHDQSIALNQWHHPKSRGGAAAAQGPGNGAQGPHHMGYGLVCHGCSRPP